MDAIKSGGGRAPLIVAWQRYGPDLSSTKLSRICPRSRSIRATRRSASELTKRNRGSVRAHTDEHTRAASTPALLSEDNVMAAGEYIYGHGPLIYGRGDHCCELGSIERPIVDDNRGRRAVRSGDCVLMKSRARVSAR